MNLLHEADVREDGARDLKETHGRVICLAPPMSRVAYASVTVEPAL